MSARSTALTVSASFTSAGVNWQASKVLLPAASE
ncbi:hypothetical protein H4W33_009536 [Kibdelosporangium phytohabitans]|nr:hypothetical protein [Kibdelosporangium phytohabitans]